MRIELSSLEGGRGRFSHAYTEGELAFDDDRVSLVSAPQVSGEIRSAEQKVVVEGRLSARVQVECDRCLKAVQLPVDSKFKLEYVSADQYKSQHEAELSAEDLDLIVFNGESIDVDELVSDELRLAVPDHLLCNDECKGICQVCGVDRNLTECHCATSEIDPRWADLKGLVKRK